MKFSKEYEIIKKIINELDDLFFSKLNNLDIDINDKGKNDIVTSIDVEVEKYTIKKLQENFPDDNIISEETKSDVKLKNRNWVIDPIDGTCNFATGIPLYGFQIALTNIKDPLLSVIYLPELNQLYYAEKDNGAYLNNKRIFTSKNELLEKAIVTLGDFSKSNETSKSDQLDIYPKLYDKILRFRMLGAACFDFCFLASGKTHAHIMFSNKLWDIMPGLLLVKEAGACITNLDGSEFDINFGAFIVTANENLNTELLKNISLDEMWF
jgi:myo-inositol-1(or 4)-monophosphatase